MPESGDSGKRKERKHKVHADTSAISAVDNCPLSFSLCVCVLCVVVHVLQRGPRMLSHSESGLEETSLKDALVKYDKVKEVSAFTYEPFSSLYSLKKVCVG